MRRVLLVGAVALLAACGSSSTESSSTVAVSTKARPLACSKLFVEGRHVDPAEYLGSCKQADGTLELLPSATYACRDGSTLTSSTFAWWRGGVMHVNAEGAGVPTGDLDACTAG